MRKLWQYCRHPHPVSPCAAWSMANHLPAKARTGEASQQDGTGAVGETDISYRAVSGRSWSLLTWASQRTCIHWGQPCARHMAARHWNCLPKTPVPPPPCKDSCSSEVPWAWLCWMQMLSISSSLGSSISLLLFPPWIGAYVRPYHTQRIQWLNAEDMGTVLYIPPKRWPSGNVF